MCDYCLFDWFSGHVVYCCHCRFCLRENFGLPLYWGLNTDKDIVWYPSILPIRQESVNNWDSCLSKLYKEFENYL